MNLYKKLPSAYNGLNYQRMLKRDGHSCLLDNYCFGAKIFLIKKSFIKKD